MARGWPSNIFVWRALSPCSPDTAPASHCVARAVPRDSAHSSDHGGTAPPQQDSVWSALYRPDFPLLILASCIVCRTRKQKCDRRLPSCNFCTQSGLECRWVTAKQPGLRAGYVSELEKRLSMPFLPGFIRLKLTLASRSREGSPPAQDPAPSSVCINIR